MKRWIAAGTVTEEPETNMMASTMPEFRPQRCLYSPRRGHGQWAAQHWDGIVSNNYRHAVMTEETDDNDD